MILVHGEIASHQDRRAQYVEEVRLDSGATQAFRALFGQVAGPHVGVNVDSSKQEVQSFSKTTDVHKLASELEKNLPEE